MSKSISYLRRQLEVFQTYTANWGFPMNQTAHERGIENIEAAILKWVDEEKDKARIEGSEIALAEMHIQIRLARIDELKRFDEEAVRCLKEGDSLANSIDARLKELGDE